MPNEFGRGLSSEKCYDSEHDGVSDAPSLPPVATIRLGAVRRMAKPKQSLRCQICGDYGTYGKYSERVLCEHHRDIFVRECV